MPTLPKREDRSISGRRFSPKEGVSNQEAGIKEPRANAKEGGNSGG